MTVRSLQDRCRAQQINAVGEEGRIRAGLYSGVKGFFFPSVQRREREVNDSPASSAKVKNEWSYTSAPSLCLHGMDRDNFTFLPYTVYLCEMSTADTDC